MPLFDPKPKPHSRTCPLKEDHNPDPRKKTIQPLFIESSKSLKKEPIPAHPKNINAIAASAQPFLREAVLEE
jgi:hypothetical protein